MLAAAEASALRRAERPARLTLRFLLWTSIGVTAAAAVMFVLVRHLYAVQGERDAIDRARSTARTALAQHLRASDLTGAPGLERRRELDRLFRREVLVAGTVRGTIYDSSGGIVYSTDRSPTGTGLPLPAASVHRLRTGTIIARVGSTRGRFGRLLETYLPVTVDRHTKAIVELDQRYGPIAASAKRTSLLITGVLEGLLLLLVAALTPVLSRASRRLARHIDELDELATHDQLTGLLNRIGFRRAFVQAAERERPATLLLLDLDAFHEVNETLGSPAGDQLLWQWSNRLCGPFSDHVIGRLGEDELGILVDGSRLPDLASVVDRLQSAINEPVTINGIRIGLDMRIGAALLPEHGRDFESILRRAGIALSAAKQNQERFALYDPGGDASDITSLTRTAELRAAIRNGELLVHYQPQADLATGAIRGAEALLRWQHPDHGLLPADEFISYAERSGIIAELDRFVLETATSQWLEWNKLGLQPDLAVNLAAADLLDEELPAEIAALLRSASMPAHFLVLEITERALLRDENRTRRVLERLNAVGVRLAIDDFGVGYSSLDYLRRLPIQQVKLDRRFIHELPHNPSDVAIVRSTTELAHTLSATVVAEGVETDEQWESAAAQGCDIAQGHLIARPLPASTLTNLLIHQPPKNPLTSPTFHDRRQRPHRPNKNQPALPAAPR
jgi:diguanylate cyclase (GGDEF)-like protein